MSNPQEGIADMDAEKRLRVRSVLDLALVTLAAGHGTWEQDGIGGAGSAVGPRGWLTVAAEGDIALVVATFNYLDELLPSRNFLSWQRFVEIEELLNLIERGMLLICKDCGERSSGQDTMCARCALDGECPNCGHYFDAWQDSSLCGLCGIEAHVDGYIHASGEPQEYVGR